jgi:hypothetical protein
MSRPILSIRMTTATDAGALERLADGARPSGRALIAERDGVPVAAVALTSGRVVADRARPVAGAIAQLRLRRYQLMSQGARVAHPSSLRRRAAFPVTAAA